MFPNCIDLLGIPLVVFSYFILNREEKQLLLDLKALKW